MGKNTNPDILGFGGRGGESSTVTTRQVNKLALEYTQYPALAF